jgi:hypothetical protein
MSISKELAELKELHESGALTDEEFAAAKEKLLGMPTSNAHPKPEPNSELSGKGQDLEDEDSWGPYDVSKLQSNVFELKKQVRLRLNGLS